MMNYNNQTLAHKQRIVELIYLINRILMPPAKIMFIFWTLCCLSAGLPDNTITLGQKIFTILFGYLFFCGIADLIYFRSKKKYLNYQMKITRKKLERLHKLLKELDPIRYQEEYGEVSPNNIYIANTVSNFPNYDSMNGHQFEHFCANILSHIGFCNVEVTQGSGDHGIDILAQKDEITYAIQCKCYSSNIGNAAIQQAHTGKSLYHKDIAVVLTNQYFTQQAKEEAAALGVKLWDRDKLNDMIEKSSLNKH